MSTTPVTPAPTPATPAKTSDLAWIETHFLSIFLVVALFVGGIFATRTLFEDAMEKHDARVAASQQKTEGVDTSTQTALLAQLQQERNIDAQRDAQQTALLATLISQLKQQQVATAKQVTVDASLDAQAAAQRLVTQTKSSPSDAVAGADTVTLSLPLTRTVVTNLDLLPAAQEENTNLQGQLSAQQTLATDANNQLTQANQVIAADKTELLATIKADDAACVDKLAVQAKAARKSKLKWFFIGFGTGVVTTVVALVH